MKKRKCTFINIKFPSKYKVPSSSSSMALQFVIECYDLHRSLATCSGLEPKTSAAAAAMLLFPGSRQKLCPLKRGVVPSADVPEGYLMGSCGSSISSGQVDEKDENKQNPI